MRLQPWATLLAIGLLQLLLLVACMHPQGQSVLLTLLKLMWVELYWLGPAAAPRVLTPPKAQQMLR